MGYSNSREVLESRREYWTPLLRQEPYVWILEGQPSSADLDTWAYKIRECFHIANLSENISHYPELVAASKIFAVQPVKGTNKVQAVLTAVATETSVAQHSASPTHGLVDQPLGRIISTAGEQTIFTIIDSWKKSQPNNQPIHFPQAALSYEQLLALWRWAQSWKPWPLMILVDGESLTLGPPEDAVLEYSWKPRPEDTAPTFDMPKSFPVPPKVGW